MPAIEVSSENQVSSGGIVILDFWADWCKPCGPMNATFDQLADTYPTMKFFKIEAEKLSSITEKYSVSAVPTFIFLKDGNVVEKIEGANGPDLINKITKYETDAGPTSTTEEKGDLNARLEKLVNFAPVMLFMKGSPSAPQCGFSRKIVDLLDKQNVKFSSFNILSDEEVRLGLKAFSNWPTYPQLYVKGKLVGGLDIVKEMVDDGELVNVIPSECIGVSAPKPTPVESSTSLPTEDLNTKIQKLINHAPIMLFMKGTPDSPKCGFSSKIVDILNANNLKYGAYDILEDESVRQALKTYSNWPTYPQLYAKGKLVGGLDIVKEMAEEGQLQSIVNE